MLLPLLSLLASVALADPAAGADVADVAEAADVAVETSEVAPPSIEEAIKTGFKATRDYALIISNDAYDQLPDAPYATRDADVVYNHLRYTRGLYSRRFKMLNGARTRDIKYRVRQAVGRVRRNGTLWIYFAGHGALTPDGERVLLGTDQKDDEAQLTKQGYPLSELVARVTRARKARQIVVILDCAFGRLGRDGNHVILGRDEVNVAPFAGVDNANVMVWMATTGEEVAGIYEPVRHGLFTYLVLGALRGWADGAEGDMPDGMVTLSEAQAYVSDSMRRLGRYQVPSMEQREEMLSWVVGEGELEPGPTPDAFLAFALQERQAQLDAVSGEAEERALMDWKRVEALASTGSAEGQQALQTYIHDWERPILSMDWVQYVPQVREARRMLAVWGQQKPEEAAEEGASEEGHAETEPTDSAEPDTAEPKPEELDDSCDDLLKLQDMALTGILRDGQIACLEERVAKDKKMTDKDKVSRVLLVNAEAKKDLERWEQLITRHLEQIDQSDPDLCFKYTIYLSKKGSDNASEVIIWASRALERKDRWTGRLYEKKVYALHRLRSDAATYLWNQAEQVYLEERSARAEDRAERARGKAKEFSRAWLDYARASDQEADTPLRMCLSAAGAMDYCEEE